MAKYPIHSRVSTLLASMALFFMLAHSQDPHDETDFEYDAFGPNSIGLIYQGDAHVPQNTQILRLTKTDASGMTPRPSSIGRVLYSEAVHFWDSTRESTFETTIDFAITPSSDGRAADGLAFFIAPNDTTLPSETFGEDLGIFNSSGTASSLFAVEFDTYVNSKVDPDFRHIGIDINSLASKNVTKFDSGTGNRVHARINYNSNTRAITVVANSGSTTAQLSYVFDLKTILPQWVKVGISSATGPDVAKLGIHDVLSWHFISTLVYHNDNQNEEAYIKKYESE